MAFSDWESYSDLLVKLEQASGIWAATRTFAEFDDVVRRNCAELVEGEYGFANLVARLRESGDYADDEQLLEHLRRIVLRSEAAADALAYDEETGLRYDATHWYLPDGVTVVWPDESHPGAFRDEHGNRYVHGVLRREPAIDPCEQHFDEESRRWRRYVEQDGEFEYHDGDDGVWERRRDDMWCRFHARAGRWLPYDRPSGTWLDEGRWRAYEEVGTVPRPAPAP